MAASIPLNCAEFVLRSAVPVAKNARNTVRIIASAVPKLASAVLSNAKKWLPKPYGRPVQSGAAVSKAFSAAVRE